MSQFFSTTTKKFVKWLGFSREDLSPTWKAASDKFVKGGSAEEKLGTIQEVYIKSRNGNPVHKSAFNPEDKEDVISARIVGSKGTKTCHIYLDRTGTTKKGDKRC
ncbi:hypothetical protein B0T21DRAFT_343773 [Apiosordaria backusii]|uniref:Uncharacterized protein n=1 Tax=Apiosordaria backusii TaxID=314023 RepID=A0AA40EYU8_9PEZI|nr:hypothetical protein B0T21DRAFT_343773 [Apiosordaria backusii]